MQPQMISSTIDSSLSWKIYIVILLILFIGIGLGFMLNEYLPNTTDNISSNNGTVENTSSEIILPEDAVQIQSCADNKGALYIKPEDIPEGPVYMVNDGKVIGIEFMLNQAGFLSGESYRELEGLGVKVDHVNVGLLSQGHSGYQQPHYHVDLYTVSNTVEENIICQPGMQEGTSPLMDIGH
jgi:hypothetical protein